MCGSSMGRTERYVWLRGSRLRYSDAGAFSCWVGVVVVVWTVFEALVCHRLDLERRVFDALPDRFSHEEAPSTLLRVARQFHLFIEIPNHRDLCADDRVTGRVHDGHSHLRCPSVAEIGCGPLKQLNVERFWNCGNSCFGTRAVVCHESGCRDACDRQDADRYDAKEGGELHGSHIGW